jgi:hypothetical protein
MSSLHFHVADICVCYVQVPALAQLCNKQIMTTLRHVLQLLADC